jgi:hypothetical protein
MLVFLINGLLVTMATLKFAKNHKIECSGKYLIKKYLIKIEL